jgi:PAS domain S-box-containing protein
MPVARPPPGADATTLARAMRGLAGAAGRRLAVLLGVVVLLLAAGFVALSLQDHRAALEEGWGSADRAAFAVAEHAERGLSAARLLTDRVAEAVRRDGPDAFDRPDGQRDLAALLRQAPQIGAIRVLDPAQGDPPSALPSGPTEGGETTLGPLRPDPERAPGRGAWFMSFERAVRDAEGRLVAIVQARIEAEDFARVTARLGLGDGGMAGLFRAADGVPLMRYPLAPADLLPPPPRPEGAGEQEGRFEAVAKDGQRLLVAWRVSGGATPVMAVAALPRAAALAACHGRLARNAVLFGLAAALVGGLGWAVAAALARGARDRAAVDEARREMQAVLEAAGDGVLALDAGWRITFANPQAVALSGRGAPLVGMTLWQAFPAPAPPPFEAAFRRAMAAREAATAESFCPNHGRRLRIEVHPRDDGGLVLFLRDITAAEDAARRVAESEARLRRVLDNLFAFVGVLAPDGRLLEANRAPLEAIGATPAELRGRPFWDCPWWSHDPEVQSRTREACRRAAAGETLRYDIAVRLPGGQRMVLDFQIAPLRDAEGRITHLIPSAVEITARVAAEDALAESVTRLRLAQEAAELGVFERYIQRAEAHWSASMFRLYGLDPAGRGPWISTAEQLALIHPADRPAYEARRKARTADPTFTRFTNEFRIRRADTGEVRWIAARGEIVRDAEGRAVVVRGANLDVTERRRAEEALAESETRLRLAQEAAELGVFERYIQRAEAHWSASMFRLHGLDPAGRGPWISTADQLALVHPADRPAYEARRQARMADPTVTRVVDEFRIRRADTGEVRWIAARGEIVRDAEGLPLVVRGVNLDVTERRRAEERQMLLAREVDHRAKNALAVVQSIIALTRDADPERFRAAVAGRIAALARAHNLLARDGWNSAGLRELAAEELAPYRGDAAAPDRVTLEGPEVALAPGAAQPLAMALHELATNAAKHGALGVLDGRVAIRWAATEEGGLSLSWSESGAAALSGPPARRGFGHSVIRNTVERQIGGACAFDWRQEGLSCRIDLPPAQLRWPGGISAGD